MSLYEFISESINGHTFVKLTITYMAIYNITSVDSLGIKRKEIYLIILKIFSGEITNENGLLDYSIDDIIDNLQGYDDVIHLLPYNDLTDRIVSRLLSQHRSPQSLFVRKNIFTLFKQILSDPNFSNEDIVGVAAKYVFFHGNIHMYREFLKFNRYENKSVYEIHIMSRFDKNIFNDNVNNFLQFETRIQRNAEFLNKYLRNLSINYYMDLDATNNICDGQFRINSPYKCKLIFEMIKQIISHLTLSIKFIIIKYL